MVCIFYLQEKEEETKRMSIQKKSADEERERLLKEQRLREQLRIRKEIEEKDKKEAQAQLAQLETNRKNKKKPIFEGVRSCGFPTLLLHANSLCAILCVPPCI
jgi:hypothetical protein